MSPVMCIEGRAYPLGIPNVDTDMIIAADHLKTVSRSGLGTHAFAALRGASGNPLEDPRFAEAPILIAGDNFGCGSSREHAVWALLDFGVRAVIAPRFSDIFSGNAFKNGLLLVALQDAQVARLLEVAPEGSLRIDLERMIVATSLGDEFAFELDAFRRECLMSGLDEIGLTLESEAAIGQHESRSALLQWQIPRLFTHGACGEAA